jgi:hypothetical protein
MKPLNGWYTIFEPARRWVRRWPQPLDIGPRRVPGLKHDNAGGAEIAFQDDGAAFNTDWWGSGDQALPTGRPRRHLAQRISTIAMVAAVTTAALAGCTRVAGGGRSCAPLVEALPASRASTLIAVIPRSSAGAASWGLRELAQLLPFVARPGLELHVLYTQDSDDLGEGGGDGGPPQVLLTDAPGFPALRVGQAPQQPSNPTSLSTQLYCDHLAAWQAHAARTLRAEADRRTASSAAWAKAAAATLRGLADKPIPDTSGPEAGVEPDSGASVFSAAQVAEAAPQPTIVFLGGLTSIRPPSQSFRFPARLVALLRSSDPSQVLYTDSAWARWAHRAGGTFEELSANDALTAIAQALGGPGK